MAGQKIENIPNATSEVVPNFGGTIEVVESGKTNSSVASSYETIQGSQGGSGNSGSEIQDIRIQDSNIETVKEPENYGPNGSGPFREARSSRGEVGAGYSL